MEDNYKKMIELLISEFIQESLDANIYNVNSLKNKVKKLYLDEFNFDTFADQVSENINEIIYDNFRIEI